MLEASEQLLKIARARFPDLSSADERLLTHATTGSIADFEGPSPDEDKDEQLLHWDGTAWRQDQLVHAEVVRWLCSEPKASSLVDLRGIRLRAAYFADRLDLAYATMSFPLQFERCAFPNGIDVHGATMKALSMPGSRCRDLVANRVHLHGGLRLTQGFRSQDTVSLTGAEIGVLDCESATFSNPEDEALIGEGMRVKGSVLLRNGFLAEGRVSLLGAEIGGQLTCEGASFVNPGRDALNCQSMTVKGNVFLREHSRTAGRVLLAEAEIRGTLVCDSATISNPGGEALRCEAMIVKGSILLRDGFRAEGQVSLTGSEVGTLECEGASFSNPEGTALACERMKVAGYILLRREFQAEGRVSFLGAEIGAMDCENAAFINPAGDALAAEGMIAKGSILLRDGFRSEGRVSLLGAEIGGQLECDGSSFFNPERDALVGQGMTVKGGVLLRRGFSAEGTVSLIGAEIMGTLDCREGAFTLLDLRGTKIGALVDDSATHWPVNGSLWLDGLAYRSISGVPGSSSERKKWINDRLRWIRLQHDYAPQPYTELRSFLHREGHEAEARMVAIARQTDLRKHGGLPRRERAWNWFLGLTIAHGYEPWRPLLVGVLIIMLGFVIFRYAHVNQLLIASQGTSDVSFHALIYSLDTFLPIVNFNEQDKWQPIDGVVRYFYWSMIALGWFFSTLFVLSFTRLVRQD